MPAFDVYHYVTGVKGLAPGDVFHLGYRIGRKAQKYRPTGTHLGLAPNEALLKVPVQIGVVFGVDIAVTWGGQKVAPSSKVDLQFEVVDGPIGADGYELAHANGDNLDFQPGLAQPYFDEQVTINTSGGPTPAPIFPASPLHLVGHNVTALEIDAIESGNAAITGRRARGLVGGPVFGLLNGDVIFSLSAFGYGTTGYSASGRAQIKFNATENWTDAAQGAGVAFMTTLNGTIVPRDVWQIGHDGNLLPVGANLYDIGAGVLPVRAGYFGSIVAAGGSLSGQLTINTSGAIPLAGPLSATSPLRLIGNGPNGSRIEFDVFGAGAAFVGRRASGTPDAPTAVKANDFLLSLNAFGYGATAFSAGPRAQVIAFADEDWTDAAQGTRLDFYTSPVGAAVSTKRWTIGSAGHFTPGVANTYDIGAQGLEVRNGWFGGLITVSGSGANTPAPIDAGTALVLNRGAGATRAELIGFQGPGTIVGRRAQGTPAAPSAVLANQSIFTVGAFGYGATAWSGQRAAITFLAAENWTDAAQGANITFQTTPIGAVAPANRWQISDAGHFLPIAPSAYDIATPAVPARSGYFSNRLSVNVSGQLPGLPAFDAATMLQLNSGAAARIEFSTFQGGVAYLTTRHARGVPGAPTATFIGDWLTSWGARGYGATGYSGNEAATIILRATETFTDTAQGTNVVIGATPVGQNVIKWGWIFQGEGHFVPYTASVSDIGSNALGIRDLYLTRNLFFGPVGAANVMLRPQPGNLLDLVLTDQSAFADLRARMLVTTQAFTVATLPAAPSFGARAMVTDANSTAFYAPAVGGGVNKVPVFYDSVTWRIG